MLLGFSSADTAVTSLLADAADASEPAEEKCGCIDNFGCSNILAIVVGILYAALAIFEWYFLYLFIRWWLKNKDKSKTSEQANLENIEIIEKDISENK